MVNPPPGPNYRRKSHPDFDGASYIGRLVRLKINPERFNHEGIRNLKIYGIDDRTYFLALVSLFYSFVGF